MKIKLYKNTSDNRYMTKKLSYVGEYECKFKDTADIYSPTIYVKSDKIDNCFSSVNYAYISDFARYYYIENIELCENKIVRIMLKCDVLSSFADYIKKTNALIGRQEKTYSPYIIDEKMLTPCERSVSVKKFGTPFTNGNGNYITLTVSGGK